MCCSAEAIAYNGYMVNKCPALTWESPGGSDVISTEPGTFSLIHSTEQTTCQIFVLLEYFFTEGPNDKGQCKNAKLTIDGQASWQQIPEICGENSQQSCEW